MTEIGPHLLGRRPPTDWVHVDKYPLRVSLVEKPTPVVLGINWYNSFFDPVKKPDGRWWIEDKSNLGGLAGGHAICVKCGVLTDPVEWWDFYNQGNEGSCVGFSLSRMMSLLNRTRYGGHWLYIEAQKVDEWAGEDYEGTSVRAGLDVLRLRGHRRLIGGELQTLRAGDGIAANRWATSVADVHQTIKMPLADSLDAVPLLNSWGRDWPHIVWLPDSLLERLLNEDGEAAVVVDR